VLTASALVVVSWIAVTGDFTWMMDTADGLAVQNPQRLQVMADSTGIWGNGGDRSRAQNSCSD